MNLDRYIHSLSVSVVLRIQPGFFFLPSTCQWIRFSIHASDGTMYPQLGNQCDPH
jgi:hypothetical protein